MMCSLIYAPARPWQRRYRMRAFAENTVAEYGRALLSASSSSIDDKALELYTVGRERMAPIISGFVPL